jgi:hypothetical protein
VFRAASDALPPERSIGSCPVDLKNHLTNQPLMPLPVKYSLLAKNTTGLGHCSGKKIESENDRWLLAKIAAPLDGTFSTPRTQGLKIKRSKGPSTNVFRMKYVTKPSFAYSKVLV